MAPTDLLSAVYSSITAGDLAALSGNLTHYLSASDTAPNIPTTNSILSTLNTYTTSIASTLAERTALENSSLLLALSTFLYLLLRNTMSWTSRLGGNLGRFSPFTRSPPPGDAKVSDADFSYITADDLRRHQNESQPPQPPADLGPPRDTDVLILKNKKKEYAVHFPAYSIARNETTIGQVREHAAKKTGTTDPRGVKLLYRGKNLKDDSRTCLQEGLRDGAEVMCAIAEAFPAETAESDDDGESEDEQAAGGGSKKPRNRGKRTKRRNKREQTSGTATPSDNGYGHSLQPPQQSQSSTRAPSPSNNARTPQTPMEKLAALHSKLQTDFLPHVHAFLSQPPSEANKRDFEHKKLSEGILAQILLKLDAVETEGDAEARQRRKDIVREAQRVLTDLDEAAKR